MKKFGTTIKILALALALCPLAFAADGGDFEEDLARIRERIRQSAQVEASSETADIPMAQMLVLKGDTHQLLAEDLTGTKDTVNILKTIQADIIAGQKIAIPRALLRPGLDDTDLTEVLVNPKRKTLREFVVNDLSVGPALADATVRNLKRLNALPALDRIAKGQKINVPTALLKAPPADTPKIKISDAYLTRATKGLARHAPATDIPRAMAKILKKNGQWPKQLVKPPVNLVVIHTTEHNGGSFDSVARYIQKNKLANYLIGPKGEVYRIVPDQFRAWGAGESLWEGQYVVDHRAINIEIYADTANINSGDPTKPVTPINDLQYEGLKGLLAAIKQKYPAIHSGRVVTHRMVAQSYTYGSRSRKGDPYLFEWEKAGLPDNSLLVDQDVLLRRTKLCCDRRYSDRITVGQTTAANLLKKL